MRSSGFKGVAVHTLYMTYAKYIHIIHLYLQRNALQFTVLHIYVLIPLIIVNFV